MKRFLLAAFLILVVGTAFGMRDFIVPKTWNYKITVEIETPEGIRTGHSVRKFKIRKELAGYIGAGVVIYNVIGEAAFVDLGERGILIDLPSPYDFIDAFPHSDNTTKVDYYKKNIHLGDVRSLDVRKHSFVTFTDINDPKSIRTVLPEDFENVFGDGVKLKNIDIEITEEPVTWGAVQENLKWFGREELGLRRISKTDVKPDAAKFYRENSFIKGE